VAQPTLHRYGRDPAQFGELSLVELSGDHFTLIDPAAPDWAAVVSALPGLLRGELNGGQD
jgi:hypothetical protein